MSKPRKKIMIWFFGVTVILFGILLNFIQAQKINPSNISQDLGVITLLPLILAVIISFFTKNIVISLFIGLVVGVLVYQSTLTIGLFPLILNGIKMFVDIIIETVSSSERSTILVLCVVIGGMVEVIRESKGFDSLANLLEKRINSKRKANLATSILGSLIFFDDYANSLIVGPIMRPITDHFKISREKLAYLVDSTAAPVTGIAIISSWVSVEVAVIQEGLDIAGNSSSAYALFLESIPFCFYCVLCLLFIFIGSILQKDYGPMLKAEITARKEKSRQQIFVDKNVKNSKKRVFLVISSIMLFLTISILAMYKFGLKEAIYQGLILEKDSFSFHKVAMAFGSSDTVKIILTSAIIVSIYTVALSVILGIQTIEKAINSWTKGCSDLMLTLIMLVLAWSIAGVIEKLGANYYLIEIVGFNVQWWIIPCLIFVICCVISFAMGSYGCLFMTMPIAVPLALRVQQLNPNIPNNFLFICIASVISGGIFGDHCSPITDCTILSSAGCSCDNMKHVLTQLPYSSTIALVSLLCGTLLATLGVSTLVCYLISGIIFVGIFNIFGKNPDIEASKEKTYDL